MSDKVVQPIDYISGRIPYDYVCCKCGLGGRKLWRQYNTFASHIELMCVDCAAEDQGKELKNVTENGRRDNKYGRSDQIGWLVPAIPTEDGETFWGYTSVPAAGVDWWREIPLRRKPTNKVSLYDYVIICEIGSSRNIVETVILVPLGTTTEEILNWAECENSNVKAFRSLGWLSVLRAPTAKTFYQIKSR